MKHRSKLCRSSIWFPDSVGACIFHSNLDAVFVKIQHAQFEHGSFLFHKQGYIEIWGHIKKIYIYISGWSRIADIDQGVCLMILGDLSWENRNEDSR